MSAGIEVALVEDDSRTREGLVAELAADHRLRVVGAWGSMEAALPTLLAHPPRVLLLDIGLPGMSGIEGLRRLRAQRPDALALVLSVFDDDRNVFEAICAGASGYLLKDTSPARLCDAIGELAAGGAPMSPAIARRVVATFRHFPVAPREHGLSPRELDVLRALGQGHSYKTAAAALDMRIDTVRFHIKSIYQKLHVHSKSEAIVEAIRSGLI